MIHNDVLRSIRFMLNVDEGKLAAVTAMGGKQLSKLQMIAFLKRDDEPGYAICDDETMAHFLDGLIIHRRGKDESKPLRPIELPVTNNTVLKKLRVAFELKDEDVVALMASTGFQVSKSELGALFRKPDHPNFRPCGDQFLRNFLKGLTERVRAPH